MHAGCARDRVALARTEHDERADAGSTSPHVSSSSASVTVIQARLRTSRHRGAARGRGEAGSPGRYRNGASPASEVPLATRSPGDPATSPCQRGALEREERADRCLT